MVWDGGGRGCFISPSAASLCTLSFASSFLFLEIAPHCCCARYIDSWEEADGGEEEVRDSVKSVPKISFVSRRRESRGENDC